MENDQKNDDLREFLSSLGRVLKQLREEKGVSQIDLAIAIDRQRSYVSELESGTQRNPTIETLHKTAQFYDLSLSELIALAER